MVNQEVEGKRSSLVPVAIGATVGLLGIGGLLYYLMTQQTSPPSATGNIVLTLTANPTQVPQGGTVTFTVVANNSETNQPVSGLTVTLVNVTTSTNIQSEVTDSTGTATFVYTVPTTLPAGTYVFDAVSS